MKVKSNALAKNSKIFIAGHKGLVGSSIYKLLQKNGYQNLIIKDRKELDLLDTNKVRNFFEKEKPEFVFFAAAKVGGIVSNQTYSADFIFENLTIQNNIIHNAYISGAKKLLFLGSSCIYPKFAKQPIKEEYLMTGPLEETNEAYAIAKIAGIKMCQSYNKQYGTNFISIMPTNLYGENDNFDLETSHVIPALIRKFYEAKRDDKDEVVIWGTGKPNREFLYVDDLAEACLFLMQNYKGSEIINVGTGNDVSIKSLTETIKNISGFKGKIVWDKSKPDGTPKKLLDVKKINALGWKAKIGLPDGLNRVYKYFTKKENI